MIFKMEESHESVDLEQINACEAKLSFKFPDLYKNFLLCQNGGVPANCLFRYDETKTGCVGCFFGVNLGSSSMDLENNAEVYKDRIPRGFFPIAEDPGGNIICAGLTDNVPIFFWFHEAETSPPTMKNMYFVSNSFEKFLEELEPDEGEEW